MRSHLSRSRIYLLFLVVTLVWAMTSIYSSDKQVPVSAFLPFSTQPLFTSIEPVVPSTLPQDC